jgi:hypothetical protein
MEGTDLEVTSRSSACLVTSTSVSRTEVTEGLV